MKRIWSPWRSKYIRNFSEFKTKKGKKKECFICDAIKSKDKDEELLIVARREKCIIVMNKYPYNSGHTLICPLRHISEFEDFENDELINIINTSQEVISAIKDLLHPHGFNFGLNVGQESGAGLPEHLHFHIVPRWNGDANFTSTIADVKFYPESLENTRKQLSELLNKNMIFKY